jgi:hypothetical protein
VWAHKNSRTPLLLYASSTWIRDLVPRLGTVRKSSTRPTLYLTIPPPLPRDRPSTITSQRFQEHDLFTLNWTRRKKDSQNKRPRAFLVQPLAVFQPSSKLLCSSIVRPASHRASHLAFHGSSVRSVQYVVEPVGYSKAQQKLTRRRQ